MSFTQSKRSCSILQLALNKCQVISQTLQHINNIPQVSRRCQVLLNSIRESLDVITRDVSSFISSMPSGGIPLNQHDYVIEFYDAKVSQLQKTIEVLTNQNNVLSHKTNSVLKDISVMEEQLNNLRLKFKNKQNTLMKQDQTLNQSLHDLKEQLRKLEEQLKKRNDDIRQLRSGKQTTESLRKSQKADHVIKILELNRIIDDTNIKFRQSIQYLEAKCHSHSRQMTKKDDMMVDLQEQISKNNKTIEEMSKSKKTQQDKINNLKEEQMRLENCLSEKNRTIQNLQNSKTQLQKQVSKFQQRISDLKSSIETTVNNKTDQCAELEQENRKLNNLLSQIQADFKSSVEKEIKSHSQLTQIKKQKQQLIDEVFYYKEQILLSAAKMDDIIKENERNLKKIEESNSLLVQAHNKIQELQHLLSDLNKKLKVQHDKHVYQKSQIRKEYEKSIEQLLNISVKLEEQLQNCRQRQKENKKILDGLQQQLEQMREREKRWHKKTDAYQTQMDKYKEELHKFKVAKISLEEQVEADRRKMAHYQQQLEEQRERNRQMQQTINELKKCQSIMAENQLQIGKFSQKLEIQRQNQKKIFIQSTKSLQQKLKRAQETISLKSLEVATYSSKARNLEEQLETTRKQNNALRNKHLARICQLQKLVMQKNDFKSKLQALQS